MFHFQYVVAITTLSLVTNSLIFILFFALQCDCMIHLINDYECIPESISVPLITFVVPPPPPPIPPSQIPYTPQSPTHVLKTVVWVISHVLFTVHLTSKQIGYLIEYCRICLSLSLGRIRTLLRHCMYHVCPAIVSS